MKTDKNRRWRIRGTGSNGHFTLTVAAPDYAEARERATFLARHCHIDSIVLIDEFTRSHVNSGAA